MSENTKQSYTGTRPKKSTKKQKSLEERKDMKAQINATTSEIAHLMDRLAITQQRKKKREVVLPFVPCPRQAGDPAIPENVDFWAIKDQVIWPKPTAKVKPRLNEATRDRLRRYDWSVGMYQEYPQAHPELP